MFNKNQILFLIRNNSFLLSLIVIHLVYIAIQGFNMNLYMVDSAEYLAEANNIVQNGVFYCGDLQNEINFDLFTKRPPVYPLFIAFLKQIFNSNVFVIFIQSILSIFSILIIRKSFIKIGYSPRFDTVFVFLLILSPAQMVYANLIMSETLFQLILSLGFYCIVHYLKSNSLKHLFYFNLLIVLSAFTKPVMYLFVFPCFLIMVYFSFKSKTIKPLLLGIISILLIQGYSFWNYKRTNYWHFSSIQTINLVQYNTYYFNVQRVGADKAEQFLDNQLLNAEKIKNYPQKKEFLSNSSTQVIKNDLVAYSWFHLKGMLRFFIDPGRFDLSNFFGFEKKGNVGFLNHLNSNGIRGAINYLFQQNIYIIIALVLVGLLNILKLGGLVLLTFEKSVDFRIRAFILILIGYVALATGPLGASRFCMPFIPIIILSSLMVAPKILYTTRTFRIFPRWS